MAIIYRADLDPTKQELLTAWLDRQAWGGQGAVDLTELIRPVRTCPVTGCQVLMTSPPINHVP